MRQPSLVTDSEGLASFYSPSSPPPPAKLIAMTDPQKQSFITTPPGPQNTDGALHHALLNVRELESQNAKLYEDNRRLAAAVHMLNERHVFLSKPQVAQLQQLTYLQELVRNIEADRLFTTRQHQDLLNSLANGTAPQLLVMQLQQSRAEYTHLLGEYNYLLDKHTRLKVHLSMVSSAHTPSHVPPGAQVPGVPSGHAADFPRPDVPSRDVPPAHSSPVSPTSPYHSFPPPQQAVQNLGRRSFDGFVQRQTPSVHGQHPVASLPTPPSSASTMVPAGPPLHMPLRPVTAHPMKPPVHIPPLPAGPRIMSAPATLPQGYHPFPQGPKPARGPHEFVDLTKAESIPPKPDPITRPGQSSSASISPSMSPSSFKRSSSVLGTPATPEAGLKRSRIEGFDQSIPDNRVANNFSPPDPDLKPETDTTNNMGQVTLLHPQAPSVPPSAIVDQKGEQPTPLSDKDLRPDEECVRMIFEKDAQVEDGVFCDPCLSRYEAGMLSEPPEILVNPRPDSLMNHCMTVHPTLWDDLRHRRDLAEN